MLTGRKQLLLLSAQQLCLRTLPIWAARAKNKNKNKREKQKQKLPVSPRLHPKRALLDLLYYSKDHVASCIVHLVASCTLKERQYLDGHLQGGFC